MGDGGQVLNGTDFFNDGFGSGTCFQDNGTVTLATRPSDPDLYPTCPATAGSGTVNGDKNQVLTRLGIISSNPPSAMEKLWTRHPHVAIKGITPLAG